MHAKLISRSSKSQSKEVFAVRRDTRIEFLEQNLTAAVFMGQRGELGLKTEKLREVRSL